MGGSLAGAVGAACCGGRPSLVTLRSLRLTLLFAFAEPSGPGQDTRLLGDFGPSSCQLSSRSFQGCGMTVQPNKIHSGDRSPSEVEGGRRPCPER